MTSFLRHAPVKEEIVIKTIVEWVTVIFDVNMDAILLFNMMLCIDLYLTCSNPFYPNGRRIKWYIAIVAVIILVMKPLSASYFLGTNAIFDDYFQPLTLQHEVLVNKITKGEFLNEASNVYHSKMFWLYAFNIAFILEYLIKSSLSIAFARKESIRAE